MEGGLSRHFPQGFFEDLLPVLVAGEQPLEKLGMPPQVEKGFHKERRV